MKYDFFDNRRNLTNDRGVVPKTQQQTGSTKDKFPIILDGGKTIIFISDKAREQEVIERYKRRGSPRSY